MRNRQTIDVGIAVVVATLWASAASALSSRLQLVLAYQTLPSVPPAYEILAGPFPCLLAIIFAAACIPLSAFFRESHEPSRWYFGILLVGLAGFPTVLVGARFFQLQIPAANVWELIGFALLSGIGLGYMVPASRPGPRLDPMLSVLVWACSLGAMSWWWYQANSYYQDYQLGFNDFGHFTQRIANTAEGRGFLLESPVLPTFWDHFNPAIACLAPMWILWPDVSWVFGLQAICLAVPAPILYSISKNRGLAPITSFMWSMAWLVHPSIGQMNLGYTYGWHPVTVAIPLLLLAYRAMLSERFVTACGLLLFACLFEEGVIVVVGCYFFAQFLRLFIRGKTADRNDNHEAQVYLALFVSSLVGFIVVYLFSGLATFQASRFLALGNNMMEVAMSPILRPGVFWSLLLRERNFVFVFLAFGPLLVSGLWRNPWFCLPIVFPLLVLCVWDHMPAQSIAFQYASCLIPIAFVGCIEQPISSRFRISCESQSPRNSNDRYSCAVAGVAVCYLLSIYVGQLPWSRESLVDVVAKTYGVVDLEGRKAGTEPQIWLDQQLSAIRNDKSTQVLATGRIAAHCVGQADIETVGQFWQRYDQLAKIDPTLKSPVMRYDVLIVDYLETFQQSAEESQRLRHEAIEHGFVSQSKRFNIEIFRRTKAK